MKPKTKKKSRPSTRSRQTKRSDEDLEVMAHLRQALVKARTAMDLSQHQVDQKCELPIGTMSQIENGRRMPGLMTVRKLVRDLRMNPGDVLML